MRFSKYVVLLATIAVATSIASPALAQIPPAVPEDPYRFRPGDRIYLSVPDRPSLNRQLKIAPDGNVDLPLVGQVPVAGLTVLEIEQKIYEALFDVYPSLEREDVTVEKAKGVAVYVTGEVSEPGKYTFPEKPNLWAAIREAGGPTGDAALNDVRIVQSEVYGGRSRVIDVLRALEAGTVEQLPRLEEEDTIIIGTKEEAYTGAFGVNIFGEVNSPGMYRLQSRHDLASALLLAGGPTDRAKLSQVTVVRARDEGGFQSYEVDLERYLEEGDEAHNMELQPGDTVNIPKQNSIAYQFKNNPGLMVSILASVVTITALIVRAR